MKRFAVSLSLILLPVLSTPCLAGENKPYAGDGAIEKVVADSMEAIKKGDWQKSAELVHPASLEDYKNMWLPALTSAAKDEREKQADLLALFDQADDLKSVIELKPKEFYVRSMKGISNQLRKEKIASPLNADVKIIGTVREGDDRAFVVVRARRNYGGAEMTQVEVVALKRSGTEWKTMLPDSVRIMAEALRGAGVNVKESGPAQDRPDPQP